MNNLSTNTRFAAFITLLSIWFLFLNGIRGHARPVDADSISIWLSDTIQVGDRCEWLIKKNLEVMYSDPLQGLKIVAQLQKLAESAQDKKYEALAHKQFSACYILSGNLHKALAHCDSGIIAAKKLGNDTIIAEISVNKGIVLERLGRISQSIAVLKENINRSRRLKMLDNELSSIQNLLQSYALHNKEKEAIELAVNTLTRHPGLDSLTAIRGIEAALGSIFFNQQNYTKAEYYLQRFLDASLKYHDEFSQIPAYANLSQVAFMQRDFIKAVTLQNKALAIATKNKVHYYTGLLNNAMGNIYLEMGHYNLAYSYLKLGIAENKKNGFAREITEGYLHLASCRINQHNYQDAKLYNDSASSTMIPDLPIEYDQELARNYYLIYKSEKLFEKSLTYLESYKSLSDSINNLQKTKIINEIETNFSVDRKEAEIRHLTDRNAYNLRLAENRKDIIGLILFVVVLVIGVSILLFFNYKRSVMVKNTQAILTIREKESELANLRMQTLKSKAIPHFTGNVLNTIIFMIGKGESAEARQYLSLFSRFVNQTLFDADRHVRTLKEEMAYTVYYLKLEELRFRDKFLFEVDPIPPDFSDQLIPSMIVHTLCENAIKHGILPKDDSGRLSVSFKYSDQRFAIVVADDGIGRAASERIGTTGTGQGLTIAQQQIELINQLYGYHYELSTTDLKTTGGEAAGTHCEISFLCSAAPACN